MQCGGTREEGIGVTIGARATIFGAGDKQQGNAKQKEEQQTNKKKRKQREEKTQPKTHLWDIA